MQTKLTIQRHGETALNANHKLRGWKDVPLDENGKKQAEQSARNLRDKKIDNLYSSDLSRAQETVKIISKITGFPIKEITKDLRPWNLGKLAGQDSKEHLSTLIEYALKSPEKPLDGGESFNTFKNRFLPKIQAILAQNQGKHIALISHHRNERLLDAWIAKGMPKDLSFDSKVFEKKGLEPGEHKTYEV